jgi:hypothetical protein
MGALERLALFTIWTICESKVSEPIFSATITNDLCRLWFRDNRIVNFFINGMGSPEIIDSSIALSPSVIFRQRGSSHPVLHAINRLY